MIPSRPAVRYYGGKWRIGEWIIDHFPAHECYCEPFGGGASVLLQKRRSPLEVYNDIDQDVVTFFRVLRNQPERLIDLIRWTPWARAEFERAFEPTDNDVERARRFYIRCWMGFAGNQHHWGTGWRYQVRSGSLWKPSSISFTELAHLWQIADRLRGVQIECRDAFDVIQSCDAPTTLFYLDPPYLHSLRSKWTRVYAEELSDLDHEELALLARALEGMVIISGYPGSDYQLWYERHGWTRYDKDAQTDPGNSDRVRRRTESIWLSPRTQRRLAREELPLFYHRGEDRR